MVFVKTEWGGYHEPPYTEDEILETARRANGGVVAFRSLQQPRCLQDPAVTPKEEVKPSSTSDGAERSKSDGIG
jgi:hypothetical protein